VGWLVYGLRIRRPKFVKRLGEVRDEVFEMLGRSYSFAIEDLEDEGPKPAEEERLRARQLALAGKRRQLRVA
jgi:hypothetical protein